MDREQFDVLTKLVWTKSSRRAALGAILGAALLGHAPGPLAARRKGKNKRKRKRKDRECYPGTSCLPGQGRNNAGCDFSHSTRFFEGDFHGAKFSNANFTGAEMAGADFRGADLGDACLVGANLLDAVIDTSTNLKDAIFCHTLMPDGATNDSGCGKGTRCCATPGPICRTCAGAQCIQNFNTPCSIFGTLCCPGMVCAATAAPIVTFCQAPCDTDQDCAKFGSGLKCCAGQALICPFLPGARCCAEPGPLTC